MISSITCTAVTAPLSCVDLLPQPCRKAVGLLQNAPPRGSQTIYASIIRMVRLTGNNFHDDNSTTDAGVCEKTFPLQEPLPCKTAA